MAFRDTLTNLRDELAAARAQRLQEAAAEDAELEAVREKLRDLAESLQIAALLEELNAVLLGGQGVIHRLTSWEEETEEDEDSAAEPGFNLVSLDGEDEDDLEEICLTLSWEEDGERAIEVELGLEEEDSFYLMVNGVSVRPERAALEQYLVEAFRDELEL